MEVHEKDGKQVIAVRLRSGSDALHTTSGKVYWRFGPTSRSIDGSDMHKYIL
jgi:predicted HTH transcriptional regulator